MANEWSSLKKIPGHKGFSQNEKSKRIYWRGTIRGKSLKISTGETQISKAKKYVDDYLLALNSDNLSKAKREKQGIKNPSLSDLWFELVKERLPSRSSTTAVRYDTAWRMDLEPFLRNKNVSDVSAAFVVAYENWFLTENPGKVFATGHKYMTMLLNYLYREGYVPKKFAVRHLDKLNRSKKEKHFRVYTPEEQDALINATTKLATGLALVGYFDTGMRKMELLARKWSDVNWTKRTIKVWSSKNKKWRTIPLTERLYGALKDYHADIGGQFIFPTRDGKSFIPSQLFDKDWADTKKAAGIRGKARVHDIRHTFATKTARDSWPIAVACEILDMTADVYMGTYVHVTPEDIATHLHRSFG